MSLSPENQNEAVIGGGLLTVEWKGTSGIVLAASREANGRYVAGCPFSGNPPRRPNLPRLLRTLLEIDFESPEDFAINVCRTLGVTGDIIGIKSNGCHLRLTGSPPVPLALGQHVALPPSPETKDSPIEASPLTATAPSFKRMKIKTAPKNPAHDMTNLWQAVRVSGLTDKALGIRAHLHPVDVARIRLGQRNPDFRAALRLAAALDTTLDALVPVTWPIVPLPPAPPDIHPLRHAMISRGQAGVAFATAVGASRTQLHRIVNGESSASISTIIGCARTLQTSPHQLAIDMATWTVDTTGAPQGVAVALTRDALPEPSSS